MLSDKFILGAFFVLTWTDVTRASIVEFNETTLVAIPPLYGFEDWSQCQSPGDVYCSVDAVLVADGPSTMLQLLKDYSAETLKHFNRTQVHRGVCVKRCGGPDPQGGWMGAAQKCLNNSFDEYGLKAKVISAKYCSSAEPQPVSTSAVALGVLLIVIVTVTFLITALHVTGDRCGVPFENKFLLAFSLKRNWSTLIQERSKPGTEHRMKDLGCIDGIRVVAAHCAMCMHAIMVIVYTYNDNPHDIEKMYDQFVGKVMMNSSLWLQAFYSLSGFLTAYTVLVLSEKTPLTFNKCVLAIVYRWIRFTPIAGLGLWFTISWYPLLGSGPQWAWVALREADDCAHRWWYYMFYGQNHLSFKRFCMQHTWHTAVDMQLHVFGMFLLLILMRFRRSVVPVLTGLVACQVVAAGLVVYFADITPTINAMTPEILRTLFRDTRIIHRIYFPAWMHIPGYIGGMGTAFLYNYLQNKGIKLNENKVFNIMYNVSLILGLCVMAAGTVFLSDQPQPLWASAVYAAIDRALVAVVFNVFLLGCVFRCKSLITGIVFWRGFQRLAHLSYSVHVVHFTIMRYAAASRTQLGHVSPYYMMSMVFTSSILAHVISVPLVLMVEMPVMHIWKAVVDGRRSDSRVVPDKFDQMNLHNHDSERTMKMN